MDENQNQRGFQDPAQNAKDQEIPPTVEVYRTSENTKPASQDQKTTRFTPKHILMLLSVLFIAAIVYSFIPTNQTVTGNAQKEHLMPIVPKLPDAEPVQSQVKVQETSAGKVQEKIETTPQKPTPKPQYTLAPSDYLITTEIKPFTLTEMNASMDTFNRYDTQRYTAKYKSPKMTADVHVFKFQNQDQTNNAVELEFYTAKDLGESTHQANNIIIFLSQDNHRIVTWPSNDLLIYIDTPIPQYAALEVVQAYLKQYPSTLQTNKCVDSDGPDKYTKGTTNKVQITNVTNGITTTWEDTCLKDYQAYLDGKYKPGLGISPKDGLLEGECAKDRKDPGYLHEYICQRGCEQGACRT